MDSFHKRITVQLSVSLAIIAALILGISLFGFQINKLSAKIAATRQELNERSAALQSLASLRSDYASKGQPYLNVLRNVVPQKDELIDLPKDFQAIAQEDGLEYGFTFLGEAPASAAALGSVKFSLSLGGGLTGLLSFLENMENFRYLVNLEDVSVSRGLEGMKMGIRGSVFFR
ncbi:MAG: type 4a pilus biogenesis protein PilO [Candidatus Brennerbacteria bacterium]|nr:type 4a pilus biogenesis protein PilO [Candidatus Brennerbacteria bacterium]